MGTGQVNRVCFRMLLLIPALIGLGVVVDRMPVLTGYLYPDPWVDRSRGTFFRDAEDVLSVEVVQTAPTGEVLYSYTRGHTPQAVFLSYLSQYLPHCTSGFRISTGGGIAFLPAPVDWVNLDLGRVSIHISVGKDYLDDDGYPWAPTQ